jgi:hypothetical protein
MQQVSRDYRVIKIFVLYHGRASLVMALGIQHRHSSVSTETGTDQVGLFDNVSCYIRVVSSSRMAEGLS